MIPEAKKTAHHNLLDVIDNLKENFSTQWTDGVMSWFRNEYPAPAPTYPAYYFREGMKDIVLLAQEVLDETPE